MKNAISVDLDKLLESTSLQEETVSFGETFPEVAARIDLVERFNMNQSDVDQMTSNQVLQEYSFKVSQKIDIDYILQEWSWRCARGYPDYSNVSDRLKLQEVLDEMGIELPFKRIQEADDRSTKSKKSTSSDTGSANILATAKKFVNHLPEEKHDMLVKFINDIPYDELKVATANFLNSLSDANAKKYAGAFKSLDSVEKLQGKRYLDFNPLWDLNVEKAMGRGELYIAFMVKNAVAQGSSVSYDIAVGSKHYEVKALDVGKKGDIGSIRPGTEGKASRHPYFTTPLMTLASTIFALKDPEMQTSILTLGSTSKLQTILDIVNKTSVTRPRTGAPIMETPGDVSISVMGGLYNCAVELNKLRSNALDKDITTSRIIIKSPTKDSAYWIAADDVDNIAKIAGKNKAVSIKVGTPITDETKDAKILLTELLNHPFVKTPSYFTDGLTKIKQSFFGDKAGLVYFLRGMVYVSPNMAEFATTESSQDAYRFDLKSNYSKWPHVQNQS